jgi:hypothetical protein
VFYILHGKEEFGLSEELASLRARLADGDQAMAQLNTTILEGTNLTLGELRHDCDTIPFMSDRRLVIVHGLLSWLAQGKGGTEPGAPKSQESASRRSFLEALTAYLPLMPPIPSSSLPRRKDRRIGPLSSTSNSPRNGSYPTGFSNGLETRGGRSAGMLRD